jgi:cytochrome b6-f complex iron-sulfur subunit
VTTLALSSSTIVVIVVLIFVDLFAIFFGLSFARARRAERAAAAVVPGATVEGAPRAAKPIMRRDFLRRSLLTSLMVFGAEFGGATLAFLWPNLRGGFGSVINAGATSDIRTQLDQTKQPVYNGAGRFYIWFYGSDYKGVDPKSGTDYEAEGFVAEGFMAIYQRCAHLGCRVPFCISSQWFECPCHGSKYNVAGEYQLGPAPTGLQRFVVKVEGGNLLVDTSGTNIPGPPRGTDTIHEPPQGPFCVAPG